MSSASRTNLTSQRVSIDTRRVLGTGQFRIAYPGTYIGGNRNQQEAVCKTFNRKYKALETEFYATDFQVADETIFYAEEWNKICEYSKEILVTKGNVMKLNGTNYLVEPLIRYFTKYTSNNGWVANENEEGWAVLAMEAFSHYTYHKSGGQMIVCDLQGRYRFNQYSKGKSRFELTDPAICSRSRSYGPTDLGEKGIETFFANHRCNRFCHAGSGRSWARPRSCKQWFQPSHNTSMLRATATNLLNTRNRARFTRTLAPVYDYGSDSSDDSW
jgi:hypothetical protein